MHIGCCAYSYRDLLKGGQMTLSDFLQRCAEMEVDGVELTAYYFTDTSKSALHDVKREAYRLGLDLCGTAVGNAFTSPDEAKRREQVQMVKTWIDHSVTLGAPGIRVFAGSIAEGTTEEEAFRWTVSCLKECAAYAGERGIMVALENHGGITGTADQTIRLVEAVGSEWLGINLDCGNYRQNPYEEIAKTVPYAVTAHVKVTTSGGEEIDYDRVTQTLYQAGYRGYLNIEYEEKGDPNTEVPAFVNKLKRALSSTQRIAL
ncbi:MAG: sugar phosphate isomerase/epimerase [Armatimonadetes bacterium]|nr:sugar phosphate isomerase/epimerase [Armatimonadota bacterium]